MARKRTELTPQVAARIADLTRRGEPAERIAADPIVASAGVSARTIGRRMRELRGSVSSRAAATVTPTAAPSPETPPLPTTPEEIPEGASLTELAELMQRCKAALASAEMEDNLPLVGQMIRVAASLAETMRKATPPVPADPNEQPDMVKLGAEVEKRFLKMIDLVAEEHDPRAA